MSAAFILGAELKFNNIKFLALDDSKQHNEIFFNHLK